MQDGLPGRDYIRTMLWAVPLGAVAGGVALVYLAIYFATSHWVQDTLVPWVPLPGPVTIVAVATLGGALVGVVIRFLGATRHNSLGQEMREGRVSARGLAGMLGGAIIGLAAGASLGPEAPLARVGGAVGTALGDRLKAGVEQTRIFALAGVSGVFGGFLSSPLGGAFLSYEFTGLVRFPFYEHLVAAAVASLTGFAVFAGLSAFGISGVLELPALAGVGLEEYILAAGLGFIGLPVALAFKVIFGWTRQQVARLGERTVLRATLGGLGFGLIGAALPLTLYSGEAEIVEIIHGEALPVALLLLLAGAKLVTLSLCLATGFPGGFIFPLLFTAGCLGVAINQLLPGVPLTLAVACTMASVGGAVMRMPFATILMVGVLAGADLLPLAAISALVAFGLALPVAPGGAPEALRQAEEASA